MDKLGLTEANNVAEKDLNTVVEDLDGIIAEAEGQLKELKEDKEEAADLVNNLKHIESMEEDALEKRDDPEAKEEWREIVKELKSIGRETKDLKSRIEQEDNHVHKMAKLVTDAEDKINELANAIKTEHERVTEARKRVDHDRPE